MTLIWIGFVLLVFACLAIDLGAFSRRHAAGAAMTTGESVRWTMIWIGAGVAFSGFVYLMYEHGWAGAEIHTADGIVRNDGGQAALLYLTAYLLEKSLSVDNLFVMAVVFKSFRVSPIHQHRVLIYGILGAIIMRGVMIGGGLFLVQRFSWLFYVFGAYLAYTGVRLAFTNEDSAAEAESAKESAAESWWHKSLGRIVPITNLETADRFVVTIDGKRHLTQLFLCLLVIEATDVMFAVDSVPAVLAISTEPFICYTSNIFAILGLRSLYFVLADMMARFKYLQHALAGILVFIGVKLFFHHTIAEHVPDGVAIAVSLSFIVLAMAAGIGWSWKKTRDGIRNGTLPPPPATAG